MRINPGDMTDITEIQVDQARQSREVVDSTASSQGAPTSGGAGSDSITLNGVSGLVQTALSAGAGERADRVQQLKQAIDSHQYVIDPNALSRALIGAHMTGD